MPFTVQPGAVLAAVFDGHPFVELAAAGQVLLADVVDDGQAFGRGRQFVHVLAKRFGGGVTEHGLGRGIPLAHDLVRAPHDAGQGRVGQVDGKPAVGFFERAPAFLQLRARDALRFG
jgi:hypothetical protein